MLLFYFPIVFNDVTGSNALHRKLFMVYYNCFWYLCVSTSAIFIDYIVIGAHEMKK